MIDLKTRLSVNNSQVFAEAGKSLAISDILTSSNLRLKIDNSKNSADDFLSVSLEDIKNILNGEVIIPGYSQFTRIVIDNSEYSARDERTVLIDEIIDLVSQANISPDAANLGFSDSSPSVV